MANGFQTAYDRFRRVSNLEEARRGPTRERFDREVDEYNISGGQGDTDSLPSGFGSEYEQDIAERRRYMRTRDAARRRNISPEQRQALLRRARTEYKAAAAGQLSDPSVRRSLLLAREAAERRNIGSAQRAAYFGDEDLISDVLDRAPDVQIQSVNTGPGFRPGGLTGRARDNSALDIIRNAQRQAIRESSSTSSAAGPYRGVDPSRGEYLRWGGPPGS